MEVVGVWEEEAGEFPLRRRQKCMNGNRTTASSSHIHEGIVTSGVPKNGYNLHRPENNNGTEYPECDRSTGGSVPMVAEKTTSNPEIQDNVASSSPPEGVNVIPPSGQDIAISEPTGDNKGREVLKSVVYGGLNELITSLGIVTSAASTQATTGKVVALSFSSLVVGLFVTGYKIAELWMNKHQGEANETEAEEVDQYEELLGNRQNYRLHFTVAILSFLIFGLVPPLVYGFTFRKPEDKNFKILAVTGVSIFCIALLAIVKAHIQRPENCLAYVKTIGDCIVDGVGASVVTSFAGGLIEKYVEQCGWFEPNKSPLLFLSDMTFTNHTWGSY